MTSPAPLSEIHIPPGPLAIHATGYPTVADPRVVTALRTMPKRLVVVDTETTGLDPADGAQVTEIAWASLNAGYRGVFIPAHTLDRADPQALRVSRYDERIAGQPQDTGDAVRALHAYLGGDGTPVHIVGSNPDFDARHLNVLFATYDLSSDPWQHRKIDPCAAAYWLSDLPVGTPTGLATAAELNHVMISGHHSALADVEATTELWHVLEAARADRWHPAAA